MSFAHRLKEVMDERRPRLTYQSIATLAGVTPPAVVGWMRHDVVPHHKTMSRLAAGLGVRLEWLRYGNGKKLTGAPALDAPEQSEEIERANLVNAIVRKVRLLESMLSPTEMRVFDDFVSTLCDRHGIREEPGDRAAEEPPGNEPPPNQGPNRTGRIGFYNKRKLKAAAAGVGATDDDLVMAGGADGKEMR